MTELAKKGMSTRRRVLGAAYVDRAEANKSAFDAPFQALITDAAWPQSSGKFFQQTGHSIISAPPSLQPKQCRPPASPRRTRTP